MTDLREAVTMALEVLEQCKRRGGSRWLRNVLMFYTTMSCETAILVIR